MPDPKPAPAQAQKPLASLEQLAEVRPELRRAARSTTLTRIRATVVRAAGVLALVVGISSCGPTEPPTPTPPPSPTPPDDSGPAPGCRGCADLAAIAQTSSVGIIRVANPIPGQYVVTARGRVGAFSRQDATALARQYGALNVTALDNGFGAQLEASAAEALANDPRYEVVEVQAYDVGPFRPGPLDVVAAEVARSWGLARATSREPGTTSFLPAEYGDGEVWCVVIDTGEPRNELAEWSGRLQPGLNATAEDQYDRHGHSSHVSGTFAGNTYGIARRCTVQTIKALDRNGSGSSITVANAMAQARTLCQGKRCVVNMSLGAGVDRTIDRAACKLREVAVVVAAAGNDYGRDVCTTSPAGVHEVQSIAGTTRADARAVFSNLGPGVQGWAPAVDIISVGGSNNGTSMASPHWAGMVARLWATFTTDGPREIEARARRIATRIGLGRLVYIGPEATQ